MARRRTRLNWIYDNDLQQFTTPSGQVITLLQIAQLLQDQVNCSHDFAGPWTGWRIRQHRLIAPGQTFNASRITPNNLRAFNRWLASFEGEQAQLQFRTETPGHSSLGLPHDHQPYAPPADRDDTPRWSEAEWTAPIETPDSREQLAKQTAPAARLKATVVELASFRQRRIAARR